MAQLQAQEKERQDALKQKAELEEDGILETAGADNTDVLEAQTEQEEQHRQDKVQVFATYRPMKVRYGNDHPESIVESVAMSGPVCRAYLPQVADLARLVAGGSNAPMLRFLDRFAKVDVSTTTFSVTNVSLSRRTTSLRSRTLSTTGLLLRPLTEKR